MTSDHPRRVQRGGDPAAQGLVVHNARNSRSHGYSLVSDHVIGIPRQELWNVQANYSLVAATVMAPNSHNWRMCDSRGRCRGIIEKETALARPTRSHRGRGC